MLTKGFIFALMLATCLYFFIKVNFIKINSIKYNFLATSLYYFIKVNSIKVNSIKYNFIIFKGLIYLKLILFQEFNSLINYSHLMSSR